MQDTQQIIISKSIRCIIRTHSHNIWIFIVLIDLLYISIVNRRKKWLTSNSYALIPKNRAIGLQSLLYQLPERNVSVFRLSQSRHVLHSPWISYQLLSKRPCNTQPWRLCLRCRKAPGYRCWSPHNVQESGRIVEQPHSVQWIAHPQIQMETLYIHSIQSLGEMVLITLSDHLA